MKSCDDDLPLLLFGGAKAETQAKQEHNA